MLLMALQKVQGPVLRDGELFLDGVLFESKSLHSALVKLISDGYETISNKVETVNLGKITGDRFTPNQKLTYDVPTITAENSSMERRYLFQLPDSLEYCIYSGFRRF